MHRSENAASETRNGAADAEQGEIRTEESPRPSMAERLRTLPASVGGVLLAVGVAGLVVPGPFGTPFLLAGGLVLAPRAFRSIDRFVQRRMPTLHDAGMATVDRFLRDLEKRYPRRVRRSSSENGVILRGSPASVASGDSSAADRP